jgi:prepilin-type N-terminal cleavage/methylation domain-containing protein
MLFISLCAVVAKKRGKKIFIKNKHEGRGGFTLIELLIVISIIGILAAIIFPVVRGAVNKAYYARTQVEFKSINNALALYMAETGNYPADANRDLPVGLEKYLGGGNWPKAPWPGSVYDWDNWAPSDLAYPPQQQVYQISVRFCSAPGVCTIPNESWASGFDYYSSVYYCISGPCRAHASQPVTYPGLCVNC